MKNGTLWPLEPHTKAKHDILRGYLGAWFPILAKVHGRILYVDGFAGPGEYEGGEPGSPIIALNVAKNHNLLSRFGNRELAFYFIEKDEERLKNLNKKVNELDLPSNFKVRAECGTFEDSFGSLIREIAEQGKKLAPSFIFIDPFGPTGFPMILIKRISQQKRSEVLINFNYQDLNRWLLSSPANHKYLDDIYGSDAWRQALNITVSKDKEEFLRQKYQEVLESLGWKVRPFQMINVHNQTQYYLFFATGNPRGMMAMKDAMWRESPSGSFKYSDLTNPNQMSLFDAHFDEEYSKKLAIEIFQKCKGRTLLKKEIEKEYLDWHPVCIGRHLTRALKILEGEGKIIKVAVPNKTRRANSFRDDCTICFAP